MAAVTGERIKHRTLTLDEAAIALTFTIANEKRTLVSWLEDYTEVLNNAIKGSKTLVILNEREFEIVKKSDDVYFIRPTRGFTPCGEFRLIENAPAA